MRDGPGVSLAGVALVLGMWTYALLILLPLRLLAKRSPPLAAGGLGARYSPQPDGPTSIGSAASREADFDDVAPDYDRCVGPFARPIFSAALDAMAPHLARASRVLDVGCGPGAALRRVAPLVNEGEVVGIDVSFAMLQIARDRARQARLENVALFQVDAAELPLVFTDSFDLAYSCLVHHHFADPPAAVRGIVASLRSGGAYAAVDATGPVLTKLATPLTRAVDPGWVGFPRQDGLIAVLASAGLRHIRWVQLSPGIGMAIGWRP